MRIELLIPGDPVGKGRPRVTRHGTFTPRRTKDYERKIFECWREQSGLTFPDDVPLKMRIEAFFKIPKSYSKGKRERIRGTPFFHSPDADNVIKAVADALNGAAYKDDSRVYRVTAVKLYSDCPHVKVVIED